MTLSLCMIVKNEEDTLGRCLDCVKSAFDEIIVVDTGSTDATVKIAESRNAKVHSFEWCDDFAAARNYSFSLATCDYVMWLDADDIMESGDVAKLVELKRSLNPKKDRQAALRYEVAFDDAGRCTMSYWRERIFLRSAGMRWEGEVHEVIPLLPDCRFCDIAVKHVKVHPTERGRNLRIYEGLIKKGALSPRQLYYYGRELHYNGLYEKCIATLNGFLSGAGQACDKIAARLMIAQSYKVLGRAEEARRALIDALLYGAPTAEICCAIGDSFFDAADYLTARYWYLQATTVENNDKAAFVNNDCGGFVPFLQLCVCCDKMGEYEKACEFNERAAAFKPENAAVRANREYFRRKGFAVHSVIDVQ